MIVCKNGEKINPELLEGKLQIKNAEGLCLFADGKGVPTLLVSVGGCFTVEAFQEVYDCAVAELEKAKIKDEVPVIALTTDKLLGDGEFKISRKKIAKRYNLGSFTLVDREDAAAHTKFLLSILEQELRTCFAQVLQIDEKEISPTADFFLDLGGSSLDYFTLLGVIKEKYGVEIALTDDKKASSVQEFYRLIQKD